MSLLLLFAGADGGGGPPPPPPGPESFAGHGKPLHGRAVVTGPRVRMHRSVPKRLIIPDEPDELWLLGLGEGLID